MKTNKHNSVAARLSMAALALPGLMPDAFAGRVEETYNGDFQYGRYVESGQRMEVDVFEGAITAPIGKSMTGSLNLVRDTISGASPRFNIKNAQGDVEQVLSGASIREERDAISSGLTYYFDSAAVGIGGGFSRENDYTSRYVNTNASYEFNKKLTTLNFGASVALDDIEPTGYDYQKTKSSQQYLLGLTQIIDKDSLILSNITFGYHQGFLSDPYKLVFFDGVGGSFGSIANDTRPSERFQWAWLTQYVRHFKDFNSAALHADYRFYTDDWGINAHTVELSWHQPLGDDWQIIPRFRYYSQDRADFFQAVFSSDNTDAFYSSDYRLAGFGTLSGGVKLSKEIKGLKLHQLKLQAGFEYYDHKANYQLGGNNGGNFSDFNYYLLTASFNMKF